MTEAKLNSWQQALIYIGASVAVGELNMFCWEIRSIFKPCHYSGIVSLIVKSCWGPIKKAVLRCLGRAESGNQALGMGAGSNQANAWPGMGAGNQANAWQI